MIDDALVKLITTAPAVAALVGDRLYPNVAPQDSARPYMVYSRVTTDRNRDLDGPTGNAAGRFQFDAYAERKGAAQQIMTALRQALDGYAGPVALAGSPPLVETIQASSLIDEIDFGPDGADQTLYRVMQEYRIAYLEP